MHKITYNIYIDMTMIVCECYISLYVLNMNKCNVQSNTSIKKLHPNILIHEIFNFYIECKPQKLKNI